MSRWRDDLDESARERAPGLALMSRAPVLSDAERRTAAHCKALLSAGQSLGRIAKSLHIEPAEVRRLIKRAAAKGAANA